MKSEAIQQAILAMAAEKISIREISRKLKVSRKLVRRVIHQGVRTQKQQKPPERLEPDLIRQLFTKCKGNAVRLQEILAQEYNQIIAYSTLTRMIREAHLRKPKARAGIYPHQPGEEMHHDTSPHKVCIDGKTVTAQCAALALSYSRKIYAQYMPRFTRFEAKYFLHDAVHYLEGAAGRCVIDNTSVILAGGCGSNAVFAAEMEALAGLLGFEFFAHAIGHSDRKAVVERYFHYIENNFLPARMFTSWQDLNQQLLEWCDQTANAKEKRSLGMSPQAAWLMEKPFLQPLPSVSIPLYKVEIRIVDNGGYVHLETNRYSVPERLIGKQVEVHKYLERVHIVYRGRRVADHQRVLGARDRRILIKAHHHPLPRASHQTTPCRQQRLLQGIHPDIDAYLESFRRRVRGRGVAAFQRLLGFKRDYPADAFLAAIQTASEYGLYDLTRLEAMILERVAGDYFQFDLGGDLCD